VRILFRNKSLQIAVFAFLMIVCASAANAVMDTPSFRYNKSVFSLFTNFQHWLDPRISWKNKWKNGDPAQGEAFILSSTAFVTTTDAWHFFKAVTIICSLLAIIAPFTQLFNFHLTVWLGILITLKLTYSLIFEGLFTCLFIK